MACERDQILSLKHVKAALQKLTNYKQLGQSRLAWSSILCPLCDLMVQEWQRLGPVAKGGKLERALSELLTQKVHNDEDPERAAYYGLLWMRYFRPGLRKRAHAILRGANSLEATRNALPKLDGKKVSDAVVKRMIERFDLCGTGLTKKLALAEAYLTTDLAEIERKYLREYPDAFLPVDMEKSSPKRIFVPLLLKNHVKRQLQEELVEAVTAVGQDGRPVWRGVVLYGLAGMGKTTLATGVARDKRVEDSFPDGILWVDASVEEPEQWLERLCTAIGLKKERWERWADCWQGWVREPDRRCLLIVDDEIKGRLGQLLASLGPQVVVMVTTQDGHKIRAEVGRWVSGNEIREIGLRGMEVEEGRQLVRRNLGRDLEDDKWLVVQKIGDLVGWHPEALRLAAMEGGREGWQNLLEDLQSEGMSPVTVDKMLERQWMRMDREPRQWLLELVRWMKRGGRFGVQYGAAVWGVDLSAAKKRLARLEHGGLVERMEGEIDALEWIEQLWRVTPVVYRKWGSEPEDNWTKIQKMYPRWRLARRVYKNGGQVLEAPWRFQIMNTLWGFLALVKGIVAIPLWIIGWMTKNWQWHERWMNGTILLTVERHLKDYWMRAGVEPTEEFWLIYDSKEVSGLGAFLVEMIGAIVLTVWTRSHTAVSLKLPASSLGESWPWPADIFVFALMLASFSFLIWSVAWRAWVAHLYGIETWDLRMIAWLARFPGMKDPKELESLGNEGT